MDSRFREFRFGPNLQSKDPTDSRQVSGQVVVHWRFGWERNMKIHTNHKQGANFLAPFLIEQYICPSPPAGNCKYQ